jgi:hypothetical protein
MDIKALRKGIRELKKRTFPYNFQKQWGFHDAIEECSKLIEKQIRKYRRKELKLMKQADRY